MRIGIVGAGRVGCSLALGLYKKKYEIDGIYSRSEESALFLNSLLGLEVPNDITSAVNNSEVIFLTVPDMELLNVVRNIEVIGNVKGKTFFHCSGAETSDILQPLRDLGATVGSLHPIQTFADKSHGYSGLSNIYFSFEGDHEANIISQRIVNSLDSKLIIISKESKTLYHAAACILSNYMVTLSYAAENMLEKAGIDKSIALKAFEPLIKHTVENIAVLGSVNALTGPVSRGDNKTVENHLEQIAKNNPENLDLYKILLKHTVDIAIKGKKIDEEKAGLIKRLGE